jgi:hypothetical protein
MAKFSSFRTLHVKTLAVLLIVGSLFTFLYFQFLEQKVADVTNVAEVNHAQVQPPSDSSYLPKDECELRELADRCFLPPTRIQEFLTNGDTAVIDGRSQTSHSELNISGSFNFELTAIKTKSYLQTKNLLLVGQPYERRDLEETCIILQKRGFRSVQILLGGLPAWVEGGQTVAGNVSLLQSTRVIPVHEFLKEVLYRPWLLVDTDDGVADALTGESSLLHGMEVTSIPFSDNTAQFLEALRKAHAAAQVTDSNVFVGLILNEEQIEDGVSHVLDRLLMDANFQRVFIVEGGRAKIEEYLAQHAKVRTHLADRWKRLACH